MDESDRAELERRRLTDELTHSIELTLTRRYTWLAIITGFLLSGGVYIIVDQLTQSSRDALNQQKVFLDRANKSLDGVSNRADEASKKLGEFNDNVKERVTELTQEIQGVSAGKTTLNERVIETLRALQEIQGRLEKLELSLKEAKVITIQPSSSVNQIDTTLDKAELGKYTVVIHFKYEEQRPLALSLSRFLKEKGYVVPDVQLVDQSVNDVRYFNESDFDGAKFLQEEVIGFLKTQGIKGVSFPLNDLGYRYPDVKDGVIEFWFDISGTR